MLRAILWIDPGNFVGASGGRCYPVVIRFFGEEWAAGEAGLWFGAAAAEAGQRGAVTRL